MTHNENTTEIVHILQEEQDDSQNKLYAKALALMQREIRDFSSEIAHVDENVYYDGYDGLGSETQINDLYVIIRVATNQYRYYMFTRSHICGSIYNDQYDLVSEFEENTMSMSWFEYHGLYVR